MADFFLSEEVKITNPRFVNGKKAYYTGNMELKQRDSFQTIYILTNL